MAAAGLTRGGFYAHFADKTEMIVEAMNLAFAQAERNLFGFEAADGDGWLAKANGRYLNEAHVADIGGGCALPPLGGQIPRASDRIRESFARNVERVLDLIASKIGDGSDPAADRREATRILAQWIGAMTLARVFPGERSSEILEIGRAAVAQQPLDRAPTKRAAKPARDQGAETPVKASAPKRPRAVSPKTRASAASSKPAPSKAWTSRSQA